MASVIAVHCIGSVVGLVDGNSFDLFARSLAQPFKFGTIGFFLISGFLMGEGISRRTPLEYLTRRLQTVLMPWLAWVSLCWILSIAHHRAPGELRLYSLGSEVPLALDKLRSCLLGTSYWFVPNLLLALCVLLLCRSFIDDLRLGLVLLMASLFYGLNIYARWIPLSGHTGALFGFVFYLWLGAWVARHFARFETWMAGIPLRVFAILPVLTLLPAILESQVMSAEGIEDNLNTLRLSNQLYSVTMVLAMFKLRTAIWPRKLNVRATTFGIYLSHAIVLSVVTILARWILLKAGVSGTWHAAPGWLACLSLGMFAAIYGTSLGLTTLLLKFPRLRWLVGAFPINRGYPASLDGATSVEMISLNR